MLARTLRSRVAVRQIVRSFSSPAVRGIQQLKFNNIAEMLEKAVEAYSTNPMFGTKVGNNYEWINYTDFGKEVDKFRAVLQQHKIGLDDKVAIISNNRVEWAVAKYALSGVGAQIVPMYEAQLEKDWHYILEDSGSKLVIAATESIYEKVKGYPGQLGKVESVICLDAPADKPYSYKGLMAKAATLPPVPINPAVTSDHVCAIIYTSGTTGKPKGVELTHRNIQAEVEGLNSLWMASGLLQSQTSLAFLPWAHVFGMTCELHHFTVNGNARAIVPTREMLLECLALARPTCIISVPVLFNRVYDGVMKAIEESSPLKQKLFHAALAVSRQRNDNLEFGRPVSAWLAFKHKWADRIVFSKIREKLGGRMTYMAAGGASTSLPVLQFFEDIGVPILEGYGLTETAPVITSGTSSWDTRRLGCVGVAIPGVTVRIINPDTLEELPHDTDGEITCSGDNVMKGYHNNKAATDEVFYTHNGQRFFRTGDMGRMIEGKFLKITGRIKEQFKLENGKYVVPAPLEDAYARSPFIAQIYITGNNNPHPVALVVPNYANLLPWWEKHVKELKAQAPTPQELADPSTQHLAMFDEPAFTDLITQEMIRIGAGVKGFERPGQWLPIVHAFSQENQMLTPKMSLRRTVVAAVYKDKIDALYANKGHKVPFRGGSKDE